jgi:hypothetical protein
MSSRPGIGRGPAPEHPRRGHSAAGRLGALQPRPADRDEYEGLVIDVRANGGGEISQLVLEKLAHRVIAWDVVRWHPADSYPLDARRCRRGPSGLSGVTDTGR